MDDRSCSPLDFSVIAYEFISDSNLILEIPGGYVIGFRSLDENSTSLVFSKLDLEEAKCDEYRFDKDKWNA